MQSYSLQTDDATDENDVDATSRKTVSSGGGAEWWVQVKPAGTSRAPVDLHYDKDEVLAETFGLGSFPTLSTVTYLTEGRDNAPTIIFPHTYNDEEDRPIESMLLSRAARAKHVVFDGRLLHGAPAHPALLVGQNSNGKQSSGESYCEEDAEGEDGSLRVTFLVNIWKSGRPAGVHMLPESIRTKIRSAATGTAVMPLEFQERHVSKLNIPAKSLMIPSSADNGVGDETKASEEENIILPFVSHGATWIGGDEVEVDVEECDEGESVGEENSEEDGSRNTKDEGDNDEEEEEEEEDELVLVLSPFATPEYMEDTADTIVLSFEGVNRARLVRGGMFDGMNSQDCRWKKLAAGNKLDEMDKESSSKTTAAKFLLDLNEEVPSFVPSIVTELKSQFVMDVSKFQADHVCYRTDSIEQYTSLVEALKSDTNEFTLLVESEIGGRPIATFKLTTPIEIKSDHGAFSIDAIEIPSPKEGSPYKSGLEHVEFVVGDGSHTSPINDEAHKVALKAWIARFPSVSWNTKSLVKQCNPDVSTKLELGDYGNVSVKFHLIPLEDVIKFETEE